MSRLMHIFLTVALAICFVACDNRGPQLTEQTLTFSQDTMRFDTVFTTYGSITKMAKIYNFTRHDLQIQSIRLRDGRYFKLNVDGHVDLNDARNITLPSGDSLHLFVKVLITEQNSDNPILIDDDILITTSEAQQIHLEAYGQDIEIIDRLYISRDTTLRRGRPRLVKDYIAVDSTAILTIDKGVLLIMSDTAQVVVRGTLICQGTLDEPIIIRGDKMYHLFDPVPYDYVSGLWEGVFIVQPQDSKQRHHRLEYTNIHSANYGLYCYSRNIQDLSDIEITNSYIHNNARIGLFVQNYDTKVGNTEITNSSYNCVYLAGGKHQFVHNTIANYFNSTNIAMHTVGRQNVSAVLINNLSKRQKRTEAYFYNNIIAGRQTDNLVIATPLPEYYIGEFSHNYIMADTIDLPQFHDNTYPTDSDTIFINTYYDRDIQLYYNFQLDSISPARAIADPAYSILYPLDRQGKQRPTTEPADAGCYQYTTKE